MPATCLEPVPPPSMDAPAEHSLAALALLLGERIAEYEALRYPIPEALNAV